MKLFLLLLITCSALAQEPKPIILPATSTEKVKQLDQTIKQVQDEANQKIQLLQLMKENAILSAFIELGLKKEDLVTLELFVTDKGEYALRKKVDKK